MVMMMIPHLVTGALPGGLVVQVEGASPSLIGSNPGVFFPAFSQHPLLSPFCWPWCSLGKLLLHMASCAITSHMDG